MIGQRLLHYEILEKLGEGGMGVVYKARDTHLDRFVALKVLPAEKMADASRKARFTQEAKAASALNHPNIVHIYDIATERDTDFIAMEHVAGKSLDQLIPRQGMRLNEALKIAIQIADALARAHAAGIVHRDLKPSNVMVDEHGTVKLIDFGLAKLVEQAATGEETTVAMGARTEEGTVVGTAAYLSPERAEGRPTDARSDIFAFGALLYEMLSGRRAFQGTSRVAILGAVLREEPAPLAADLPPELRKLVERCLKKDPERRYQHIDDVKVALVELKEDSDSGKLAAGSPAAPRRPRTLLWVGLAAGAGIVLLASIVLWRWPRAQQSHAALREIPFVVEPGSERFPVFSPDGETVAFMNHPESVYWSSPTAERSIRLKMLGTDAVLELKKNAWGAAWSPDGKKFAYYTGSEPTTICVMPRIGGAESKITEVRLQNHPDRTLAWTSGGKHLISQDKEGEKPFHLVLVSVESGEKVRLTTPPDGIHGDSGPALSPDGRTLAFTRCSVWRGKSDLHLLALDAGHKQLGAPRLLRTNVPLANCAVWTPDGKEIVFCSEIWNAATLWRVRVDGSGKASPLPFGGRGAYCPGIAPVGNRLIYAKHVWDTNIWRVELDSSGLAAGPPRAFIASSLRDDAAAWSPDGNAIAFKSDRGGTSDIWICDASGKNERKLTSVDYQPMYPRWSPDSQWIAFVAAFEGNTDICVVRASGGPHRRLASNSANDGAPSWSQDGKWIYFSSDRGGQLRLWKVALEGGETIAAGDERVGVSPPGSNDLYYVSFGSLFKKPADGGGEVLILSDFLACAVSAKGVYYRVTVKGSRRIMFLDFSTGERTKITDVPVGTSSGMGLSVSPDGRYLLYTQCDRETDDLMLVENFR